MNLLLVIRNLIRQFSLTFNYISDFCLFISLADALKDLAIYWQNCILFKYMLQEKYKSMLIHWYRLTVWFKIFIFLFFSYFNYKFPNTFYVRNVKVYFYIYNSNFLISEK